MTLSLRDLKDIIVRKTVSCILFLGVVGGLPHCGKSTLVQNFLKHCLSISIDDISLISMNTYQKHGLSRYGVSILGGNADETLWWMPLTQHSMHTFTCSSAILHDSLLQGQQVELDQSAISGVAHKIFDNDSLNRHLSQVYCDIDRTLRRTDVSPELKRVLSSGVFFGNVVDAGFSKGLYEFSSLISRYAHRQLGFVVVSIDDIQHLHEPPNLKYADEKPSMQRRSRISYLVQFAASTLLATSKPLVESPSVAFIITYKDSLTPEQKESAKKTLDDALSQEARSLGLQQANSKKILVLNPADQEDSKQLKYLFEEMLKKRSQREHIKLSWIFLRSLFYFSNRLFIKKDELKALAAELDILNDEYEAFLQTFTEFASIFYFPDIHALKDIVILQPAKFVNLLLHLFYPPKGSDTTVFDGLFSEKQIADVLSKEESQIIETTLCSLGLAASINSKNLQVAKRQRYLPSTDTLEDHFPIASPRTSCLFVPSARRGKLRLRQTSSESTSLFIIYDFKFTPPDVQGLFTQQFLSLPKVVFVPTSEVNVIKFIIPLKRGEYSIQVVFHRTCLELVIDYQYPSELNSICEKVLQCCKTALDVICRMIKDLSYRFALVCLQPQKLQLGHQVETHYEFPSSKRRLCYLCEASKSPLRNCWNKTVLEVSFYIHIVLFHMSILHLLLACFCDTKHITIIDFPF